MKFRMLILSALLANLLSSCSPSNYSRPTRKEIDQAMKYSTWEYVQPRYDMTPKQFYK
jgi:hypothetical protein